MGFATTGRVMAKLALPSCLRLAAHPAAAVLAAACALGLGCVAPVSDPEPDPTEAAGVAGKADGEQPHAQPVVLRLTEVRVREPHFFVRPLFSCIDFTDKGAFGEPSINELLNASIREDDPEDPDGMLDLSLLLLFRPFDAAAAGGTVEFGSGQCSAPADSTECDVEPAALPSPTRFSNESVGQCLRADEGHLSTQSYEPRPATIVGPCFKTEPMDATLRLGVLELPLRDVTIAATYEGTALQSGMLRGFLRQSDADTNLLPPDLAAVGGQPVSIMLPGGEDNCADHDDRDERDGELGWWLYVDFTAERVAYVGP